MKNLILPIAVITLSIFSCKAQHIIPVEDTYKYIGTEGGLLGDYDYVYVKDVNNQLAKFIGTWKGKYNNNSYEFRIMKITTDDGEVKEDELLMRYKITDTNGIILENTLLLPNDSPFIMKNGYIAKTGTYVFYYIGKEVACGQNGWFFFNTLSLSNNTKADVFLQVEGEMYPECTTGEAKQILPTVQIELIKQ